MVSERTLFLLRNNNGRLALPRVLAETAADLGRAVGADEVGRLEDADQLWSAIMPALETTRVGGPPGFSAWTREAQPALERGLAALGDRLSESEARFLPSHRNVGPIRARPVEWLRTGLCFAERTEEFLMCIPDGAAGLFLQFHRSDWEHGERYPYELQVWGNWLAIAVETLPFQLARGV